MGPRGKLVGWRLPEPARRDIVSMKCDRRTEVSRRREKFDRAAREHFLAVLRETASPTRAAAAVGVSRTLAYGRRDADLGFRAAWDAAVDLAMERLLEEGYRRAVDGVEEPVVQGGRVVSVLDPETGEE